MFIPAFVFVSSHSKFVLYSQVLSSYIQQLKITKTKICMKFLSEILNLRAEITN